MWQPGYGKNVFDCGPLLTWSTQVSNIFGSGRWPQIHKNCTSNRGDNWGWLFKRWQEHSFISDDTHEAVSENWSAQLDELESIIKMKWLDNTYENCAQLLQNAFNVTYAVYLLQAQKCQPPGGVVGHFLIPNYIKYIIYI